MPIRGYIVGTNGAILKTTNGGTHWTILSSGTTKWLESVCFTDANTGYTVGYDGIILKTTNGGTNWVALSSGTTDMIYIQFILPMPIRDMQWVQKRTI